MCGSTRVCARMLFWMKGLRVCARKFLCDADAETHWGTQNSLDTIIFGRKPFVWREVVQNSIFSPIFDTQSLTIHVLKAGSVHAQQIWNRNLLKIFSQCFFKDFYHFFERRLFLNYMPKILLCCTLTHGGWRANKREKHQIFVCKRIFFPGCPQKKIARDFATMSKVKIGMQHIGKKEIILENRTFWKKTWNVFEFQYSFFCHGLYRCRFRFTATCQCSLFLKNKKLFGHVFPS